MVNHSPKRKPKTITEWHQNSLKIGVKHYYYFGWEVDNQLLGFFKFPTLSPLFWHFWDHWVCFSGGLKWDWSNFFQSEICLLQIGWFSPLFTNFRKGRSNMINILQTKLMNNPIIVLILYLILQCRSQRRKRRAARAAGLHCDSNSGSYMERSTVDFIVPGEWFLNQIYQNFPWQSSGQLWY